MGEDSSTAVVSPILILVHLVISCITMLLFIIFIAVVCATVIPELYQIDYNTDHIEHVEAGTDHIPAVQKGIDGLHDDLTTMIGQLNLAAGLLISIDSNIASLCNGGTCAPYYIAPVE